MAEKCFIYFSFSCFNEKLSENIIIQHITNGSYVWLEYAEKHWLDHVKGAAKALNSSTGPGLVSLILRHLDRWKEDDSIPAPAGGFDFGMGDYKEYSGSVFVFLR